VNAALSPTANAGVDGSVALPLTAKEEADRRSVEALVAEKSEPVRELFERLRPHLEANGAKAKSTKTDGGDVRYYFADFNFAEVRFRRDGLMLRLRAGRGAVTDSEFAWNKGEHDSSDIGQVRLRVGEAIPAKVLEWIALAQTFTRTKHG
jgi:hypothetical protein